MRLPRIDVPSAAVRARAGLLVTAHGAASSSSHAGVATAHADAVKEGGGWVLQTVYVDVGSPIPQRLVLMAPEAAQQAWFGQGGSGGGSAFQH